jgi:hypothetical protein
LPTSRFTQSGHLPEGTFAIEIKHGCSECRGVAGVNTASGEREGMHGAVARKCCDVRTEAVRLIVVGFVLVVMS